jgi:CelD/BcsL family acetyltransferase involved in cellulose biosynthesis
MTGTLSKSHAARRRDMLTLDLVRDEAGFYALEPCWDALVDQMATRSPFVRWDWMRLWWEECGADAQLAIAVLRNGEGAPQAIAPLMLARESDHARRHLVTLAFLSGFGEAHGERLDFIVPEGRENELAPQLCQAFKRLRAGCDIVRLNFLPQESANTPHILAALGENFVRAGVLNRYPSRCITLPASWEEIEARHGVNWRGNLRRSCKTFATQHGGLITQSGERLPHMSAFDELCRLHAINFSADASTFTAPPALRLHRRIAAHWLPRGQALLTLLESRGTMVAAMYGFIERGEFFQYQMGWDDVLARLSPGKMAVRACIMQAIRRGLRTYDMLPGDYEYKQQWCDATRWVLDLEAHNPVSLRATVFHTLRAARRRFRTKNSQEGRAA